MLFRSEKDSVPYVRPSVILLDVAIEVVYGLKVVAQQDFGTKLEHDIGPIHQEYYVLVMTTCSLQLGEIVMDALDPALELLCTVEFDLVLPIDNDWSRIAIRKSRQIQLAEIDILAGHWNHDMESGRSPLPQQWLGVEMEKGQQQDHCDANHVRR